MEYDELMQKIEVARRNLETMEQRAGGSPGQYGGTEEVREQLSAALEELHVATEELRQQNEELLATRQAIEAERQRYQDLFEFAPEGYLVTDLNGIIQEANHAATAALDVDQEFLMGKPLLVFVAEEDRKTFHDRLAGLRTDTSTAQDWEIGLQPRHGAPFPASMTVGKVRDKAGRLDGFRWLLQDVTERRRVAEALRQANEELERRVQERTGELAQSNAALQAEVALHQRTETVLRESEERHRHLLEFAPETIALHRGGIWVYMNPAGASLLGAKEVSEIIGRPVLDFVHPDDRATVEDRIRHVETGDRSTPPRAIKMIRLDGQLVHVEAKATSTTYQGMPAVLVILRDITERMQVEDKISWLASFPELNKSPVLEVDLAGNLYYANPAAMRLLPEILTMGSQHPWLTDLPSVSAELQRDGQTSVTREAKVGNTWYFLTLFDVPGTQRIRIYGFDITKRKQAEAEREWLLARMLEDRNRLQTLIRSIADEVWVCDAEGKLFLMNAAAVEGLGLERAEELYPTVSAVTSALEIYTADGRPRATEDAPLFRSLRGETLTGVEEGVRDLRTGEMRYRLVSSAPFRNQAGRITGAVAVARDITNRKRAEEALRRYQLLAEGARDIVLFVRRDGRILEANRAAVEAYGHTREELLALTIRDIRAPETRDLTPQQLAQADAEGILFETVHCRKDGTSFPVEVSSRGTMLGGERVLLSIIRDITDRKRAEAALREGGERLRLALRAANAGSWEWNLVTREVGWSEEHYALFGVAAGSIEPSYDAWLQSVHPDDREMSDRLVRQAMDRKEDVDIEYRIIRPDGSVRWLNSRGHSFSDEAGQVVRMLGITIDITERKQAGEVLWNAREMLERQLSDRTAELSGTSYRLQNELTLHERADEELRRLGQALERRAKELVALDRAGRALTTSLDPEVVLSLLMREVRELLGTEGAGVLRFEPRKDELVFIAAEGAGLERLLAQRVPIADSIAGWVLRERQTALVHDMRGDPRFYGRFEGLAEIPLRSMLAVPLISKGIAIGVLGTVNKIAGAFSEDDLQILAAIANAAAIAIENAGLYAAEQCQRRRLEAVRIATAEITRELDLAKALRIITRRAAELVGAGAGTVWLWDEGEQALITRASLRPGQDWSQDRRVRLGEGVAGLVAEQRKGLIVNEYRSWPHALPYVLESSSVSAVLAEPLIYHDRFLGVLVVDNEGTGQTFTQEDGDLLALFAAQAAIAIQNAQLFEQVQAGRERLENLSRKLVEIQEAERRHIARELHDEIGQSLTGLKLILDMSGRVSTDVWKENRADASALVNDLLAQVRELSLELRPAMLDDLGLLPALAWYLERYRGRTNVVVHFQHTGVEGHRFPAEVETAAYRVVQEALTNVARHARVGEVAVRLWAGEETLGVQVEDRGVGFDPAVALAAHISSGLAGMRERAELLGGWLTVESTPGAGTSVTTEFPLQGGTPKT
jgi:PAS domain S-box-containing protein